MANVSKGNCFICGAELSKIAMKNHIMKAHSDPSAGDVCRLLKAEGKWDKNYWLLLDIPLNSSLAKLDSFLRNIWLECCDHLSAFFIGREEITPSLKIHNLCVGDKLTHEYDFGTTTETIITVMGETHRPKQRESVRLLARNVPPVFVCAECGKPGEYICRECMYDSANPFFCGGCADKHTETQGHDGLLPVTNSPRMGECGYGGELDIWKFDAEKFKKAL
ncbi:MAG: hypothetical protein LBS62_10880 [Clostridiales bacterium]|jgi:hypothetical protein|nr:hypothetical protein [Clostridiales bacterium]